MKEPEQWGDDVRVRKQLLADDRLREDRWRSCQRRVSFGELPAVKNASLSLLSVKLKALHGSIMLGLLVYKYVKQFLHSNRCS
jgi:hypothetical protein